MPPSCRRRPSPAALALALLLAWLPAALSRAADVVVAADTPLTRRVVAAVRDSAVLGPRGRVQVSEVSGTVVLSGWTATVAEREALASAIEAVPGVGFVEVGVHVRPSRTWSDAELASAVEQALREARGFEGPVTLDVSVQEGLVTLGGFARSARDRHRAEDVVAALDGPRGLDRRVRLDPVEGVRAFEVRLVALLRQRDVEIFDLEVDEDGGRVVINGRTFDVASREAVEEALRQVPGGHAVVNAVRLVVTPAGRDRG